MAKGIMILTETRTTELFSVTGKPNELASVENPVGQNGGDCGKKAGMERSFFR
jgi:hypothetical protein